MNGILARPSFSSSSELLLLLFGARKVPSVAPVSLVAFDNFLFAGEKLSSAWTFPSPPSSGPTELDLRFWGVLTPDAF